MSEKLTIGGLTHFKEKLDDVFSHKNHKHSVSSIDGLSTALEEAGKVKTVNGLEPDVNGNIDVEPNAEYADVADKATKDSEGNVITSTYATKTELANASNNIVLTLAEYNALATKDPNAFYFIVD